MAAIGENDAKEVLNTDSSSMIETLSVEVMVEVTKFMDIPSRLQLASCNTFLQRRVYRECKSSWVTIDFEANADEVYRDRLQDHGLACL
jgi:hypothetical protein